MLPSYASSAQREKMNRHGYGAGANGSYSLGGGERSFSINPNKYDKYGTTPYARMSKEENEGTGG